MLIYGQIAQSVVQTYYILTELHFPSMKLIKRIPRRRVYIIEYA